MSTDWLLLVHQIPPVPAYLRAKVGTRLARIGAIAVKNAVYVLPAGDAAHEQFQWLRTEIVDGGGEATILAARFVDGLTDADVVGMFRAARDRDYAELVAGARALARRKPRGDDRRGWEQTLSKLEARLAELSTIDFFAAAGGEEATALLRELRGRLDPPEPTRGDDMLDIKEHRDRTWVTRTGVKVDRIASAWLIRRFIDERARFKFVEGHDYAAAPGEIRFDMRGGDLTHQSDNCTFEVMVSRFGLAAPGLAALAEIIHDIDLDEDKYGRAEKAGVAACIAGVVASCPDDTQRIERGSAMLDALLVELARRKGRA